MRQAFETAAKVYEDVKKTVAKKWEVFKNNFEGTKSAMAQEVMKAESPEDLIATGKKLMEQGEALKKEQQDVKQEELGEDSKYETGKSEMMDSARDEADLMNKEHERLEYEKEVKAQEEADMAKQIELDNLKAAEELAAHEEYVKTTQAAGK